MSLFPARVRILVADGRRREIPGIRVKPRHEREGGQNGQKDRRGSELSTSSFRARHRIEPGLGKKKKDRAGMHRA